MASTSRTFLRILLVGGFVALLVAIGGTISGRARMGTTEADAFARLQREVRRQFDDTSRSLERMAAAVATRPGRVDAAVKDTSGVRALFDAVDQAWRRAGGNPDLAITVYGPDAQPLAWSGRPSEIVRERIVSDEAALFTARGPFGLRLVYEQPVLTAGGRRVGSVASERLLSTHRGIANVTAEDYTLATSMGTVTLRPPAEGGGERSRPYSFLVRSPRGELMFEVTVDPDDLRQARSEWTSAVISLVLAVVAITVVFLMGPLLDLRAVARNARAYAAATATIVALLLAGWTLLAIAGHEAVAVSPAFAPALAARAFGWLIRSPFDFLLAGVALLTIVALAYDVAERWRLGARRRRGAVDASLSTFASYVVVQFVAGLALAALIAGYQLFLRATFIQARVDILHFSVHPWNASRLLIAVSLVLFHACVLWFGVLLLRVALSPWRRPRGIRGAILPVLAYLAAFAVVAAAGTALRSPVPWLPTALAYAAIVLAAVLSRRVVPRFRHASQGFRLILAFLALLAPAIVMYPTLMHFASRASQIEIERVYAPEVMTQREAIKTHLANAMDQIDGMAGLADLVQASAPPARGVSSTDAAFSARAFLIWSKTDLATARIASAIELYDATGTLVSRFALYLPEYRYTAATAPAAMEASEGRCSWDLYEYVSRFGSQERKLLHAGRAICAAGPGGHQVVVGSIAIHAMLDYSALPFLSSQNPYYELLRPQQPRRREGAPAGDVDLTVYGWSGRQIYTSAAVSWPLDDAVFRKAYETRSPFWTSVDNNGTDYDVYVMNDRGGIYTLAYPAVPPVGHLVNLAELTTLVGLAYLAMLGASLVFRVVTGHRSGSGRALLREIRASFYRKVFLAFVAVAVVPVIILAFVAQAYIGGRLRADTEAAAVKTGAIAQHVIQDVSLVPDVFASRPSETGAPQQANATVSEDDIMVWLSGVIDQDVNVFLGPRLMATSERDLFASQLLPERTPADVYRAIMLDRRSSFVGQEPSGEFPYMLAAAPVRMGDRNAILIVPLMLRQQEIEREIDDMNRRTVLASVLFILLGAGIGYPMAERIADPVNRLTRATRRIARGDLTARIAATSSDELRRLVEAFNSMAADLQRQREQLERTNRLEAWHEMARQVAHEIKNPLTPIQLSAEHLQRVHSDRGRPLSPVLDECITSILSQVRLLRQISAEFSSFASSPTANPAPTSLADLIDEVVGPYRSGLAGRISLTEDVPDSLPLVFVDRTLVGRALANIVENALHAMPGTGALAVRGRPIEVGGKRFVEVAISDTGIGMDAEALERLFEPYFSTKAIGTGLGLAIAKRNITLNAGTIRVESQKGKGTTVYLSLPAVAEEEATTSSPA